jgi:multidrug efflux system membrane fusion protein
VKALALVAALLALASCGDGGRAQAGKAAAPPPVPVGVATVEQKSVPLQVLAVGNVQAYTTVGVKSQVAGQIVKVHFKEGDEVKRGDLLFTIDPRPLEASVRQAEANVAKDRAQLSQVEAARGQRQAEITQAQANLDRDLAQLENARSCARSWSPASSTTRSARRWPRWRPRWPPTARPWRTRGPPSAPPRR